LATNNKPSGRKKYLGYLFYLIPIAIILLGYVVIIAATNEPEPFTIVSGPSMRPTILPGSIAMITKTPFDQLTVGDIIVFTPIIALENPNACQSGAPPTLATDANIPCFVIHRIVEISNVNGKEILTTSGDNNRESFDPCNSGAPRSIQGVDCDINSSMYVGRVILQLPLAGYATQSPYNFYIIALIVIALIADLYFERGQSQKPISQTATSSGKVQSNGSA
jgi:signal peptidase I